MWILLFVLLAPLTPAIDLYAAELFYTPGRGFYDNGFFHFLFKYGELFGLGTGGVASLIFGLTFFWPKWKKWRSGSLAMILTLVIGAGLITNVLLKGHWGRPRPKEVIEFGGKHSYRPFWRPEFHTQLDSTKSFPSGHVAMGFYFFSLYFVGKRYKNRLMRQSALFLIFFLGGGLMVARVAQGGHFVSDVVTSLLIMWYVARGVEWLVFTWGGCKERDRDVSISDTSQEPRAP
jgi:lipid A 4'-phosphatase